jgi:hypothetical protein
VTSSGGIATQLGTQVLRKSFTASAFIVGQNPLLVPAGGLVRVDSLALRVAGAFTSGGAPTLVINQSGVALTAGAIALGSLTLGAVIGRAAPNALLSAIAAGLLSESAPAVAVAAVGGIVLSSDFATPGIVAVVAVALYTGGTLEVDCVWAPLTAGATLA